MSIGGLLFSEDRFGVDLGERGSGREKLGRGEGNCSQNVIYERIKIKILRTKSIS